MFQPLFLCYAARMIALANDAATAAATLARNGDVASAYELLQKAVAAGDARAAAALANWRMSGDLVRRDLPTARDLFERAFDLGLAEALPPLLALLANGAGGTAERRWQDTLSKVKARAEVDPAFRRQAELLESMNIDDSGLPLMKFRGETLSSDPEVRYFRSFLSPTECAYLIDRARPILQPAVVVHPRSGALVPNPVRTSSAAAFPFVIEDPVLNALNNRIAAASTTTYRQGEPLQVLNYQPGQEYKLHSDALPSGNQRVLTFLVYLNDDFQGGSTVFPKLGLDIRGRTGDALMFRNVDAEGRPHARSFHAGSPVTKGQKVLLSKWIREKPLDLSGPPGRPF